MSFTTIILESGGNNIYAIADKREGKGCVYKGELINWEHNHDNSVKLNFIKKDLYLAGFCDVKIGDLFLEELKKHSHLPTSKIIEVAKTINRSGNLIGHRAYDTGFIFGKHDNGEMFIWTGDEFGNDNIEFANSLTHVIRMEGGLGDTISKCVQYFGRHFKHSNNFHETMVNTLQYAAFIDKVISPEFDFIIIKKEKV